MLLVVAAVLGGCGLVSGHGFQGSAGCVMVPGAACREQLDRVAAWHADAAEVTVTCTVPVCDRKGGAGTVLVTLADGSTVKETFAYTGDPTPIPAPACSEVAPDACQSLATSTVDGLPLSKSVRAISIACTVPSCTREKGEADVRVQFGDGSVAESNTSWDGPLP
jgi:hypothetical protein